MRSYVPDQLPLGTQFVIAGICCNTTKLCIQFKCNSLNLAFYQYLEGIRIICASESKPQTHATAGNDVYLCLTAINKHYKLINLARY